MEFLSIVTLQPGAKCLDFLISKANNKSRHSCKSLSPLNSATVLMAVSMYGLVLGGLLGTIGLAKYSSCWKFKNSPTWFYEMDLT